MSGTDFNWDEFKTAVTYLKKGIDQLYFRDVIKAATERQIIEFDTNTLSVMETINTFLKENLQHLSNIVETNYKGRPNELGNYLEKVLKKEISQKTNITCTTPTLANGTAQSAGYPDYFIQRSDAKIYADVKTFQSKTLISTLRSFYYQPTNQVKIQHDAPHCLIGFEAESIDGDNKAPFRLTGYKIIDLYDLKIHFKAEFNANNIEVYSQKALFSAVGE